MISTDLTPKSGTISRTDTMSSCEIAELTGKRHDNVVRDLKELERQGVIALPNFEERETYGNNNIRTIYRLPKRETLILTSGYSAIQRSTIIDRWLNLEGNFSAISPAEQILMQAQQLVNQERKIKELEYQQAGTQAQVIALVNGEDFYTIVGFANLTGKKFDAPTASSIGKATAAVCRKNGWEIGSARHPVYGKVNSYPREALEIVFKDYFSGGEE